MTATATKRNVEFKPAVREAIGLWINMVGGTGSGKTFSAMRLASGIAGDKPFAVIDTENRRALHYADQFKFDHAELRPPFRPQAYTEAILAADEAGYPVIVIDSGSHVWAGDGGILDWHEEVLEKRAGDDWKRREALKMAAWIEPKMAHKQMVQKLLQVKAHIILCLRAEPKVEMAKENGKTVIREKHSLTGRDGWIPVCDKNLPFEATCSFLLMADHPGEPLPIKLQEQHKSIFPPNAVIDEAAGKRLAEWAKGGNGNGSKPQTFEERRDAMIGYFNGLGVTTDRILACVMANDVADITPHNLAALKDLATEIKSGTAADKVFPRSTSEPPDYVDSTIHEQPADEEPDESTADDELEKLRANIQAKLEEFPKAKQKDIMAGRTLIKDMGADDLNQLAIDLRKAE